MCGVVTGPPERGHHENVWERVSHRKKAGPDGDGSLAPSLQPFEAEPKIIAPPNCGVPRETARDGLRCVRQPMAPLAAGGRLCRGAATLGAVFSPPGRP